RILPKSITLALASLVGASLALPQPAAAQPQSAQDHILALKASVAASREILKQYEWIQTTVVSVKGEQQSRAVDKCYYGADNKVQKVPIVAPPPPKKGFGIRGAIERKKQEEMTIYTTKAVSLVKLYIPLDPSLILTAKVAGNISVSPQPGNRVQLTI